MGRTPSLTLTVIVTASTSSVKLSRALRDSELQHFLPPSKSPFFTQVINRSCLKEDRGVRFGLSRTTSFNECDLGFLGGGVRSDKGICGVGSWGGGGCSGNGWSADGDSNHGNNRIEPYYQEMIKANPVNALILSNYARFMREVLVSFWSQQPIHFPRFCDNQRTKRIFFSFNYRKLFRGRQTANLGEKLYQLKLF